MPGNRKTALKNLSKVKKRGRPKGAKNKTTQFIIDQILETFIALQKDPKVNLKTWSKNNPEIFYRHVMPKIVPKDVKVDHIGELVITWKKRSSK
jgi:hypothetical protein